MSEQAFRNEALAPLDPLVGTWRVELSNAEFLDDEKTLAGEMAVSWLDGGALLVLRSVFDGGPPRSIQVVGRNEDTDEFTVLYADDRGVSRVYEMRFGEGRWSMSRADPDFHQRFEGQLSHDGRRIDATWTRSHDEGATWIHDFDLVYRKD